MAPGMKIFKREAAEPVEEPEFIEEEEPEQTTLATHIFRKLHKVRVTTPTTTSEPEGLFCKTFFYDFHSLILY